MTVTLRNEDCGCIYSVHTPNFDIDEQAMQYGTLMYAVYAWEYLHQLPNADHSETFKSVDALYHAMGRPLTFYSDGIKDDHNTLI